MNGPSRTQSSWDMGVASPLDSSRDQVLDGLAAASLAAASFSASFPLPGALLSAAPDSSTSWRSSETTPAVSAPVETPAKRTLCVSIHDVAPQTWEECERLARAVRAVVDIPLTWLVVPRFHGSALRSSAMERGLDEALARGDELVLHGLTHLDESPRREGIADWLVRRGYTEGEGEFAAIGEDEARHRIEQGMAWFRARGWRASGFVAPAWLMGEGAWRAVRASEFLYTTTYSRFHLPADGRSVFSPSLVYMARNRAGRAISPVAVGAVARFLASRPRMAPDFAGLTRLALHPRDARFPRLVRHAQRMAAYLLASHTATTKQAYAELLARRSRRN